jgi:hypothetical protein
MKRILLVTLLFIFLLTAGCQTAAQRQSSFIRENMQVANQKITTCIEKVATNPAYQSISVHVPLSGKVNPTLVQLTDNGMPTDEDIQVIIAIHNEMEHCRGQAIEDYSKITPGIIPMAVQMYHAGDLVVVDLIQRKITWGEYNKRRVALRDEFRVKIQAFYAQLDRDLVTSHRAEIADRQRAANALSQWSYQQQTLWQNQQLINTLNRPTLTNCTTTGNMTNCRSY